MGEIINRPGIRPRLESIKNLWRDKMYILRGEVVVVGIETSLLDRPQVVNGLTGKVESNVLAEEAVRIYVESPTTIEQAK